MSQATNTPITKFGRVAELLRQYASEIHAGSALLDGSGFQHPEDQELHEECIAFADWLKTAAHDVADHFRDAAELVQQAGPVGVATSNRGGSRCPMM